MENEWNRGRNLWISRMVLCNGLICEGTRVTGGGSGFVVIGYGIYLSRHTIEMIEKKTRLNSYVVNKKYLFRQKHNIYDLPSAQVYLDSYPISSRLSTRRKFQVSPGKKLSKSFEKR
jgi:hypothetical protein